MSKKAFSVEINCSVFSSLFFLFVMCQNWRYCKCSFWLARYWWFFFIQYHVKCKCFIPSRYNGWAQQALLNFHHSTKPVSRPSSPAKLVKTPIRVIALAFYLLVCTITQTFPHHWLRRVQMGFACMSVRLECVWLFRPGEQFWWRRANRLSRDSNL
jgi:hypothetical protein